MIPPRAARSATFPAPFKLLAFKCDISPLGGAPLPRSAKGARSIATFEQSGSTVVSLDVLHAWALSKYSGFPPQPKGVHVRLICGSQLAVGCELFVSLCWKKWQLVLCVPQFALR